MTRKTSRWATFALAAVMGLAMTTTAHAQQNTYYARSHLGFHGAYNFDVEEAAIGAQATIPVGNMLEFYPSFDVYFVDPGSLWALNLDLKYRITGQNFNWLYIGGGMQVARASVNGASDSNVGLNLLAGVESRKGAVHPYAEFRGTFGDGSSAQVAVGLNFTLGNHYH